MFQFVDDFLNVVQISDNLYCDENELYKTLPLITGSEWKYNGTVSETAGECTNNSVTIDQFSVNGRAAFLQNDFGSQHVPVSLFYLRPAGTIYSKQTKPSEADVSGQTVPYLSLNYNPDPVYAPEHRCVSSFTTNIPVFLYSDLEYFNLYLQGSDEQAMLAITHAVNYKKAEYNPKETKMWTYSCRHANVTLTRGNIQENSSIGYRTLKFQSNTEPAFYIDSDTFEVVLIAREIIASVYVQGPEQVADNIPDDNWTEGSLAYTGPFYTSVSKWIYLKDETPPDGNYVYPIEYQTNIPVFANREDAEEAIRTGDYSKAGPSGVKEYDVKIGDEEEETEFGGGGFMSPFFTILSGGKTDIHRLADFLFSNDQSVWEDIKKGLEMYGSNPIDYIISLKAFPFNVDRVVNESTRHDIYFGSYMKHFETPFNEVINMAHKYIDAGSFFMYPIQYCYLDFEPYTTLSAYFPYHGWEQLDIKKYYQKTVNVRYYVDILAGQAIIVTVCDGVITDQFGPCEIGTELPLTGANFAQWAQGQVRLLTQSASSLVGGISGGVTSGNVAGFAASSLTSLIPASQALHDARQQGGPKNTMITKGNFGSNLGNYLPGYVIFRFDIHEMLEPDLLQSLAGRPSYSSGVIRNFSGFVSGKVVKMDTSGMSDSEANRIKQMIMNGIYV